MARQERGQQSASAAFPYCAEQRQRSAFAVFSVSGQNTGRAALKPRVSGLCIAQIRRPAVYFTQQNLFRNNKLNRMIPEEKI
jgi:hypothetical protein